jgi:hypothetical protein
MGSVSAIDSVIFKTLFGTEEIRKVSNLAKLQVIETQNFSVAYGLLAHRFLTTAPISTAVSTLRLLWPALSQNAKSFLLRWETS